MYKKLALALVLATAAAGCHRKAEKSNLSGGAKPKPIETPQDLTSGSGLTGVDAFIEGEKGRDAFLESIDGADMRLMNYMSKDEGSQKFLRLEILIAGSDKSMVFEGEPGARLYSQRNDKGVFASDLLMSSSCVDKDCQSVLVIIADKAQSLDPDARGKVGRRLLRLSAANGEIDLGTVDSAKNTMSWAKLPSLKEGLEVHAQLLQSQIDKAPLNFKALTGYKAYCGSDISVSNCNEIIYKWVQDPMVSKLAGRIIGEIQIDPTGHSADQVFDLENLYTPWAAVSENMSVTDILNEIRNVPMNESLEAKVRASKVNLINSEFEKIEALLAATVIPSTDTIGSRKGDLDVTLTAAGKLLAAAPLVKDQIQDLADMRDKSGFRDYIFIENKFSRSTDPDPNWKTVNFNIDANASTSDLASNLVRLMHEQYAR